MTKLTRLLFYAVRTAHCSMFDVHSSIDMNAVVLKAVNETIITTCVRNMPLRFDERQYISCLIKSDATRPLLRTEFLHRHNLVVDTRDLLLIEVDSFCSSNVIYRCKQTRFARFSDQ